MPNEDPVILAQRPKAVQVAVDALTAYGWTLEASGGRLVLTEGS